MTSYTCNSLVRVQQCELGPYPQNDLETKMSTAVQGFAPLAHAVRVMTKKQRYEWSERQLAICISKQIREIRKQRGYTQAQLAKMCGTGPSQIARIENPKNSLHTTTAFLCRIAAALDCALNVQFVSWSEFLIFVIEITGKGVNVCKFEDDEFFKEQPAENGDGGQGPNAPSESETKESRPKRGLPGKGE